MSDAVYGIKLLSPSSAPAGLASSATRFKITLPVNSTSVPDAIITGAAVVNVVPVISSTITSANDCVDDVTLAPG